MAVLKSGTTIGGSDAIHAGNMADHGIITSSNIGSYALTGLPSNVITTAGGAINGYVRINQNWAGGDYSAEALTIRGTYPSITLRSTTHDSKWLIHNDNSLSFYYGAGLDNNDWSLRFRVPTDGNIYMSWAGAYISTLLDAKQNASTAITTSNIGSQSVSVARQLLSPNNADRVAADDAMPNAGHSFIHTLALGPGGNDGHILGMTWAGTTSSYGAQIFIDTDPNDIMAIRSRSNAGVWTDWKTIIHSGTIGSQSVNYATSAGSASSATTSSTTTHYQSRTDGTWYNAVWAAGNPSHLYSADSVRIRSSDGAFRANIYYDNQDDNYYLDPNGVSKLYSVQPLNLSGATLNVRSTDAGVNGSGNYEQATFIDNTIVTAHVSTGNGSSGSCYNWYNTEWININPEKDYEFTVWVKSDGNDSLYFGWHELNSSGSQITSNPYFHGGRRNTGTTWVKLTARLKGWRTPANNADTEGIDRFANNSSYLNDIIGTSDGVMHSATRAIHMRFGTCYGSVNGSKTYFYAPRIREITYDEIQNNFTIPYYNGSSWGGKLRFGYNDWGYYGIGMYGAAGEFRMSSDSGDLNLRVDGWIMGHNYIQSHSAMYSPIYYDGNDSAYYLDPNGGSRLSTMQIDRIGVGQGVNNSYRIITNGDYYANGGGNYWAEGRFKQYRGSGTWHDVIDSGNIGDQSVSYADESGFASSAGSVEWTSVQNKPATFPPSSHTHDDRYYTESESDGRYLIGTNNPGSVANFLISIGNNGSYSYVQSHAGQPLYLNPVGNSIVLNSTTTVAGTTQFNSNTTWFSGRATIGLENQTDFARFAFYRLSLWDWDHGEQMVVDGNYVYANNYLEAGNSLRAPIFYDSNDTAFYVDPNSNSRLVSLNLSNGQVNAANNAGGRLRISSYTNGDNLITGNTHNIVLGPYSTRSGTGYYAGIAINGLMNYNGGTSYDVAPHIWIGAQYRDTPGSERSDFVVAVKSGTGTSGTGSDLPEPRFRVDYNGIASATGSFRAPIFYDSDDTGYYLDPNSTGTSFRGRGEILLGPNTSGQYTRLGGNGGGVDHATLSSSNGNLHIDCKDGYGLYLNYYSRNTIYLGTGGTITDNGTYYSGTAAAANTAYRASRANGNFYIDDNYGNGIVGVYSSYRYQGVFAMGDSYKLPADGTSTGSLYGLAWSHPNAGGVAGNLSSHGLLVMENGTFLAAISGSIRARDDMRAPIFYDSNDTGYYLDPNGTSNLLQLNTSTRARWGMPRWWNDRSANTSDQNYWTGTNGWGVDYGNWSNAWRGGFSGWDIWGYNTDHPQGSGYVHAQGIVSGQHAAASDGSTGYGWMMVGAADATANRYWLRGKWGGSTSGWVEMITTGNISSYIPASLVDGGTEIALINTSKFNIYNDNFTERSVTLQMNSWDVLSYDRMNDGTVVVSGEKSKMDLGFSGAKFEFVSGGWAPVICEYVEQVSDINLKHYVTTIPAALDKVKQLRGVNFLWKKNNQPSIGFIAQEVEEVLPVAVGNQGETKTIDYSKIVPVLTEAIKEQQTLIEQLMARLEALEAK